MGQLTDAQTLRSQYGMLEILCHMLSDDGHRMKQMQQNAMRIGKPNAARDISKMAEELILQAERDAKDPADPSLQAA